MCSRSMKAVLSLVLLAVLAVMLVAAPVANAQDGEDEAKCEGFLILGAWSRPTIATSASSTGVVYATIVNLNAEDDTLLSVSAEVAPTVEIHTMFMTTDGVMQMAPVEESLVVPGNGGVLELKPGGYHVMLIGLQEDLPEGEVVDVTLNFEHAGAVAIQSNIQFDTPTVEDATVFASGDVSGCPSVGFYQAEAILEDKEDGDYIVSGVVVNFSTEDVVLSRLRVAGSEEVEFEHVDSAGEEIEHLSEDELTIPAGSYVVLSATASHISVRELLGVDAGAVITLDFSVAGVIFSVPVTIVAPDMEMQHGMDMDAHHSDMDMSGDSEGHGGH